MQKWQGRVASCQLQLQVARCPLQVGHLPRAASNREKERKKNKHTAEFMQNWPWGQNKQTVEKPAKAAAQNKCGAF